MDEKTENYWRILDANLGWIRYSDAKATGILTIYGVLITVAFTRVVEILEIISGSWLLITLMILSAIASLIAILYGFRSISPRLIPFEEESIIYFGSIVSKHQSIEEFCAHSHAVLDSENGLDCDLAAQIYINAKIASAKFRNVSTSILFFVISFILIMLEMLVYFIMG